MSIESLIKAGKQSHSKKKKRTSQVNIIDEKYTGKIPIWDNWKDWTVDEFMNERQRALNFYAYYFTAKDLRPAIKDWMQSNRYSKEDIRRVNNAPDYYPGLTAGSLCTCMNRGMPSLHPEAQAYHDKMIGVGGIARSDEDFVREAISIAIEEGKKVQEEDPLADADSGDSKSISPMARLQKKTQSTIILDLDVMLDGWMDGDTDIKGIQVYDKMREYELPAACCAQVSIWLSKHRDAMQSALDKSDLDLVEGYRYLNAKQLKTRVEALQSMLEDLNKFKHTAKAQRTPREKKMPSAMKQVERLKYCKQDNNFKSGWSLQTSCV